MSERASAGVWVVVAALALCLAGAAYYLRFMRQKARDSSDNPPAVSDRRPVALPPGARPMEGDISLPDVSKQPGEVPLRKKRLDAPPSPTKD